MEFHSLEDFRTAARSCAAMRVTRFASFWLAMYWVLRCSKFPAKVLVGDYSGGKRIKCQGTGPPMWSRVAQVSAAMFSQTAPEPLSEAKTFTLDALQLDLWILG